MNGIKNTIDNIVIFVNKNRNSIFMFLLFWVALYMQHSVVELYFDDYGNASLTYGYNDPSIIGTDYTITQLMSWTKFIYYNWGGRILYALILIPLIKNGSHLYMGIQSVVIIFIFICVFLLIKRSVNRFNNIAVIFMLMVVYGMLSGDIINQGIYWASASVLYVWPLFPFFSSILLWEKMKSSLRENGKIKKYYYCTQVLLIPLITLSQEQLGGAVIVFFIVDCIIWKVDGNVNFINHIMMIMYSIITFCVFLSAPGNWVRLAEQDEAFAEMSFIAKIICNVPNVLELMTHKYMIGFNIALSVASICLFIMTKNVIKSKFKYTLLVGILPFSIINIIRLFVINRIPSFAIYALFFVFLISTFVLMLFYYNKCNNRFIIGIMVSGVASVFCLVISPAFVLRSCIPYVFICMLWCGNVLCNFIECIEYHKIIKYMFVIFCTFYLIAGCKNAYDIYNKYQRNYVIHEYNNKILEEYDKSENGTIYLIEYDNIIGRTYMPCDEGFEFIDYWMKEYYDIPQSVSIEYISYKELVGAYFEE